ncbi:MAG TPA: DUF4129 domain-containing protein [Candidatus Sumerlaeota bacterium]|nr:MAG: hypothetical protein BWY12_01302 [candidate division BRC1 bacterium ADurb.Bin183]HOE63549.1 DUF4129 domain-containing protein [Candidatus Sumerlaeota bacterium]HRR30566.1 DUF4129 domain-containing protein [Candidatus Sumerlaeia bacterium]HON51335.1 DUF4129 domain-containing protein [Candidatus Sumerlaeota bacterium]HOR64611.1 DUF4129 domain-containing protein [Candidatus Sumerlaeota bacterium]
MMHVKNIETQSEKGFRLQYGGILYPLIVIQCVWIGAGAMAWDPSIAERFASFSPLIYTPLLAILFSGAALFAYQFRDLFTDYFSQFNYNEKFAYFLIHLLFFFMPLFVIRSPSATLSFLSLNLFILLTMFKEVSLNRIYAVNFFILILLILKQPNLPHIWILGALLLIAGSMCFDFFYFRSKKYNSARNLPMGEFLKIGGRYILPPFLAGIILFHALPPIRPQASRGKSIGFALSSRREIHVRPDISTKMVLAAALTALILMFTLALLNWLNKKYRAKNLPPVIELKGFMKRVRNFVDEKILHPKRRRPSSPRDSIIYDYNRFCEEMAKNGRERPSFQTPREYADFITPSFLNKKNMVEDLTSVFEKAMYGGAEIEVADAEKFSLEVEKVLALKNP